MILVYSDRSVFLPEKLRYTIYSNVHITKLKYNEAQYLLMPTLIENGILTLIYYDKCQQPRKSSCIKMLSEGYSKQEIAEQITPELKKSCAYEFIQQTQKEGLKLFREKFYMK